MNQIYVYYVKKKQILHFYCWNFSKSSNLVDLLITEKKNAKSTSTTPTTNSSQTLLKSELRKYDVTFHVLMNWRFMKEIYNSLLKLPKEISELTITSIAFCIANDLKLVDLICLPNLLLIK